MSEICRARRRNDLENVLSGVASFEIYHAILNCWFNRTATIVFYFPHFRTTSHLHLMTRVQTIQFNWQPPLTTGVIFRFLSNSPTFQCLRVPITISEFTRRRWRRRCPVEKQWAGLRSKVYSMSANVKLAVTEHDRGCHGEVTPSTTRSFLIHFFYNSFF